MAFLLDISTVFAELSQNIDLVRSSSSRLKKVKGKCGNRKRKNGILLSKLFAKILRSLEQFIPTVKSQNNFWQQNAFLPCS